MPADAGRSCAHLAVRQGLRKFHADSFGSQQTPGIHANERCSERLHQGIERGLRIALAQDRLYAQHARPRRTLRYSRRARSYDAIICLIWSLSIFPATDRCWEGYAGLCSVLQPGFATQGLRFSIWNLYSSYRIHALDCASRARLRPGSLRRAALSRRRRWASASPRCRRWPPP